MDITLIAWKASPLRQTNIVQPLSRDVLSVSHGRLVKVDGVGGWRMAVRVVRVVREGSQEWE